MTVHVLATYCHLIFLEIKTLVYARPKKRYAERKAKIGQYARGRGVTLMS